VLRRSGKSSGSQKPKVKPGGRTPRATSISSRLESYRTLFEFASDGVYLQTLEGRILNINPSGEQMLGYEPGELIGRSVADIVPPEIADRFERLAQDLRRRKALTIEAENIRRDGSVFPVEVSLSLVDESGDELVVAIVRDISERKRAEEALRTSEERYRTLVRAAPDAVTLTDLEGRIVYVSARALEIHGSGDAEDLIGRDALELIAPEERERALANMKRTLEEGIVRNLEYTFLKADGSRFPGELSAALIRDAHGNPSAYIATVRDTTDRKRAEQVIKESEATFRSISEYSAAGIGMAQRNRIVYVNRCLADMLGYGVEEIVGSDFLEIVAPQCRDMMVERIQKRMRGESVSERYECQVITKDGRVVDIEIHSGPTISIGGIPTTVVTTHDISEHKRSERVLRESEERFRGIFEKAVIGLYRTTPDGRILMANATLTRMLGYPSAEELCRRNLEREGYEPSYAREDFKRRLEQEGETIGLESAWVRRDGTTLFVRESARVVRDEAGHTLYYEGTVEDITERRRIEEALRQSRQRYWAIVEDQTELICRFLPDGTLTFVNGAYCRLFQKTEDELIGHSFFPLIAEEDREPVRQRFLGLTRQNPVETHEQRVVTPGGEIAWQQWTNRAIFNDAGDLIEYQSVGRDITERKRTEMALRESEEKYRTLVSGGPMGVVLVRGDCILFANSKAVDMLGYDREDELTGMNFLEVIAPEDRGIVLQACEAALSQSDRSPLTVAHRILRRDGTTLDVEAAGTTLVWEGERVVQAVFSDATEKTRAQELREYYRRMDEQLGVISGRFINPENLDQAIEQTLEELGTLLDVQRTCLCRLSRDSQVLEATHLWRADGELETRRRGSLEDLAWLAERLRRNEAVVVNDVGPLPLPEKTFCMERGARALLAIPVVVAGELRGMLSAADRVARRVWEPGEVRFLAGIGESFGRALERAEAEGEGERLRSQILQAQKTRAIAILAGGIAQDFRDALFTITGSATLLKRCVPGDKGARQNLERIEHGVQRMSQLVDQLYAYGSGVLPEPRRIQPNQCIEQAICTVSDTLPAEVRITTALSPRLYAIHADPKILERVFTSILTNSVDAMDGAGEIRVRSENVAQVPFSGAGERQSPSSAYVHIHVADTGRGMTPEVLAHIFEPFYSTKFIGRGLGMAEAYGVIKHYGGMIFVDSEPNRGTNVHVYLPAEAAPDTSAQHEGEE